MCCKRKKTLCSMALNTFSVSKDRYIYQYNFKRNSVDYYFEQCIHILVPLLDFHLRNFKASTSTELYFPGGHSITKHMGGKGWLEGLNQKPQNIYPRIAILKKC